MNEAAPDELALTVQAVVLNEQGHAAVHVPDAGNIAGGVAHDLAPERPTSYRHELDPIPDLTPIVVQRQLMDEAGFVDQHRQQVGPRTAAHDPAALRR